MVHYTAGILGLTVLALGNCMADWVADTVVTKSGNTQMALSSCFGSPMLSHVLGLSIAFAVSSISHIFSYVDFHVYILLK